MWTPRVPPSLEKTGARGSAPGLVPRGRFIHPEGVSGGGAWCDGTPFVPAAHPNSEDVVEGSPSGRLPLGLRVPLPGGGRTG